MIQRQTRMVVIDDDAGDIALLRRQLSHVPDLQFRLWSLQATEATAEALRAYEADVVFVDHHLGKIKGLDLVRAIRQAGCLAAIVLLTGQGDEMLVSEALRAGADDYLPKAALQPPTLARVLRYCSAQSNRRHEAQRWQLAKLTMDTAPDVVFWMRPNGSLSYVNHTACHLLGYQEQELLRLTVEDIVASDYSSPWPSVRQELCDHGSKLLSAKLIRQDGTPRSVELNVHSIGEGESIQYCVIARDLTIELREAAKLQRLLDACPDAIVVADMNGETVTFVNHHAEHLFGYCRSELLGRPVSHLLSSQLLRECPAQTYDAAMGDSGISDRETRGRKKDGTEMILDLNLRALKTEDGPSVLAVIRDVTASRESEATTRRFRAALDCCADAVFLFNRKTFHFEDMNATACRSLGYSRGELLQMGPHEFVPGLSRVEMEARIDAIMNSKDGMGVIEAVQRRKDGSEYPVEMYLTTLSNDDSHMLIASVRDLTDRRRAEQQLHEKELQLRQSQKLEAVGSLAGGVAHEFNNLLQAILGYTRFAIDAIPEGNGAIQDLEYAIKAAERAAELTKQLLGFGRRQTLHPTEFAPAAVVRDLAQLIRPLIGECITVETRIADQISPIRGDVTSVQQMLLNLCINARDAMPSGGRLEIAVEEVVLTEEYCEVHLGGRPGRYAVFQITDSGCGISPEVRERIFEPFFTTKPVGKGTGLGLSMVYGLVKQHEGMLNVYSEVGMGTTFKVYLPCSDQAIPSHTVEKPISLHHGHETILIAEDELFVRQVADRILRSAGYATLLASDGDEAVEMFQQHSHEISLALLDAVMPKRAGHEVYAALREMRPDIPVIFATGYDRHSDLPGLGREVDVPVLQKPFDPGELLLTIRTSLDQATTCPA